MQQNIRQVRFGAGGYL